MMIKYKYLIAFLWLLVWSVRISAADYYWTGGSGNWNDISHWRTSSGGTLAPTVVPGPTDNVFFDVNSGFTSSNQTVTLNVTGNCHNITFSGSITTPKFVQTWSGAQTLNIYGSSEWQSGMPDIEISSIYYRHTGEAKTIKSNGVKSGLKYGNIYFEEGNSLSLYDNFVANGILYHSAGTWNTNNHTVTINNKFIANLGAASRIINLGSSDLFFLSDSFEFNTNKTNVILNAGTSHIHIAANDNGVYGGIQANAGQTFYDVSFENPNSLPRSGIVSGGMAGNPLKFHKLEVKGSGTIKGHNNFEELILAPIKKYIIASGTTQQIINLFSLDTPDCMGWSSLESSNPDTPASFSASSATVMVRGVLMRGISGKGGATFIANNSVNNGNNTGWVFPSYSGQDLYWVGGSGTWNDKSHWAQSSGGSGGYCVPGPADNLFFDVNSGFTTDNHKVILDGTGYSRNITFSGSATPPEFTQNSTDQTLNIYGSSEWQSGMPAVKIRYLYYRHTGDAKTIKSNGVITGSKSLFSIIYFEEGNSLNLKDDFTVDGPLYQSAGIWNTNNHKVMISHFIVSEGIAPRTVNLGSSDIFFTDINSFSFYTNKANITLNAGTSHLHIAASDIDGLQASAGQTFYDVSFENPNSLSSTTLISGGTAASPLKFHNVEVKGSGTIMGYNNFEELILAPIKKYIIASGTTQRINNVLSLNTPDCMGWSDLTSSTEGIPSLFSAPSSATITLRGVIMQGISGTGGATFSANKSIDKGNNTGWVFSSSSGQDLYWVGGSGTWNDKSHWAQSSGGSGGYCVPGPADNLFFDVNSGFTTANNKVILDGTGYSHNITFSGSAIPPEFTQNSTDQTLNIYGSSEWQSGMPAVNIHYIYYRHTGEAKTIKSNGVATGSKAVFSRIYFEEENSLTLKDNFTAGWILYQSAGTWNTNNHKITIVANFYANLGSLPRTINMGSSEIFFTDPFSFNFNSNNTNTTLNAGTSNIYITAGDGLLEAAAGQTFYNINFGKSNSDQANITISGGNASKPISFNKVEFKGIGTLKGYNNFQELLLSAGKTYTLESNVQQTIGNWVINGTPCNLLFIKSSNTIGQAHVNVTGGNTNFNFVNIKDINASGLPLHFGKQSTDAGNNNNITFLPYDPGSFNGLGEDWTCHTINDNDPSTYVLGTTGFYGNAYTTYKWYKLNDSNFDPIVTMDTSHEIDIRTYGFGTYKVEVNYSDGLSEICQLSNEIKISHKTEIPTSSGIVCRKGVNTLADIEVNGTDIQWYASPAGNALPVSNPVQNGDIYYASQTADGCESNRTAVKILIKNCGSQSPMANPGIRLRIKQ